VRQWIVPPIALRRVAFLRTVLYLFVIFDGLKIANDPVPHGYVPAALYRPILLRAWLHLPAPTPAYVHVLQVVLFGSAIIAATGRLPRLAGWTCCLAMLDWLSNDYSYSKIDHDQFALVVALAVLPTVGRARYSDRDSSEAAGWAVRCIQIGAVACYFLAAVSKMRFGGWCWANGAVFTWAFTRRGTGLAHELVKIPHLVVATQWIVLCAEACSPLMLWLRGRALYAYVAFFGTFHLMTYLTIKIHFLPLVVCLLAFLPLERLGDNGFGSVRGSGLSRLRRPRPASPAGTAGSPPSAPSRPSSAEGQPTPQPASGT
jgi:hypothetical protein